MTRPLKKPFVFEPYTPPPEAQARAHDIGEMAAGIRESGTLLENMLLDEIEFLQTRCETRRKEAQRARRALRDAERQIASILAAR